MSNKDTTTGKIIEQEKVKEKKEPLFSKKNKRLLSDPLNDSNPITVQVLGICSALAITVQVKQARSEEHTSELQSHSFISYAVFCLKKKTS